MAEPERRPAPPGDRREGHRHHGELHPHGRHEPDELSEQELRPRERLREDRVDRAPFHLAMDQSDADEERDRHPEEAYRCEPHVLEDAVALDVGEAREEHARADHHDREREQRVEETAAHRLADGVARDGEDALDAAPGPIHGAPSVASAPTADRKTVSRETRWGVIESTLAPAASATPSTASTSFSRTLTSTRSAIGRGDAPKRSSSASATSGGMRPSTTSVSRSPVPRNSSIAPSWTMRPREMIATRSQTSSTSERIWVFMKTVLPSLRRRRIRSRISLRPIGSRPLIGSSRKTTLGSCTRAWARPIRWSIPFE